MVAWRWFVDGCCRLMWWLVWGSRLLVVGQPQAVLSFGPSAPLHPPPLRFACGYPLTAAGGQGPQDNTAYGLAYPLLPTSCCTSPPALYVRRVGPQAVLSFGPSAPLHPPRCASLAVTRLRPRVHGQGPSTCVRLGPSAFARMAFFK